MSGLEYSSHEYFINLLALSVLALPLYYASRNAALRAGILIFSGLYLLYFIAPRLLVFYIVFWPIVFCLHRLVIVCAQKTKKNDAFVYCLGLTLAPLVLWKLFPDQFNLNFNLITNEILRHFSATLWQFDLTHDAIVPVGLSFATFRAVDLLVKTHIGQIPALRFENAMLYGFFAPVQITGPIIEYEELSPAQKKPAKADPQDLYEGALRISSGLIKAFIVATFLTKSADIFQAYAGEPVWIIWVYLFAFSWYFYFNFSGYSDIAIGTARLYGFCLKENFHYPFFQKDLAGFWSNWHMSLYRFARRNAFIPLGGYRPRTQHLALLGTMMVIALWHNISVSMVIFALYHTAGLLGQRFFTRWMQARRYTWPDTFFNVAAKMLLTYLYVLLSFPLLMLDFQEAMGFYAALLGMGP